jgi:hypothetical protein
LEIYPEVYIPRIAGSYVLEFKASLEYIVKPVREEMWRGEEREKEKGVV